MNVLLDENTPVQIQAALQQVLGDDHKVDHILDIDWGGKKDKFLIPDAANEGYDVLVTRDSNQLHTPDECRLIKKSGIHHVRFSQGHGKRGLARAMGSVIAAMPDVIDDLWEADGQRLVKITGIAGDRKRHEVVDPKSDPPAYWR